MRVFGAIRWPFRPLRRSRARTPPPTRERPEFGAVNRALGTEPLRPELSGLRLRAPRLPARFTFRGFSLGYRWQPSAEYRRRQEEVRATNMQVGPLPLDETPPVLLYPEDTEIAPDRLQTLLDQQKPGHPFASGQLPLDLETEVVRQPQLPILQPRLPEADPDLFVPDRHLLPRTYRRFLRQSVWPRLAGGLVLGALVAAGAVWLTQLEQAAAVAAGQVEEAQRAVRAELAAAGAYGVDPRLLRPVQARARALATLASPSSILPGRAQVEFYRGQVRRYDDLLRQTHLLERRAFAYWTWDEGITYAALMEAQQEAATLGLKTRTSPIPACATPRCFRAAVIGQQGRIGWLRQTAATLRVYGTAVAAAPNPATAAASETALARNLASVTSAAGVPAPLSALDAGTAAATTVDAETRTGALAHLDVDFLFRRLLGTTGGKLIVVNAEDGIVSCYEHGKTVYTTVATAGPVTPAGRFLLEGKQPVIAVAYWLPYGRGHRYRPGFIPDWMPFSGASALQAAPWRAAFGPAGVVAGYTPATPASVDLPPAAAAWIFAWVPVGAEVVVV
jgi:hypothetical protein